MDEGRTHYVGDDCPGGHADDARTAGIVRTTGDTVKYRSKPSEIEAVQWTGDNLAEVEAFGVKFRYGPDAPSLENPLRIKAGKDGAQGYVPVPVGHWIVRAPGDLTDHWPVDPDYFAAKYEPAEETP